MRRPHGLGLAPLAALAALLLLAAGFPPASHAGPERDLEAGFGRADLTPDTPVPLGGYAARKGRLSEGIHDTVEARAAFFRRGDLSLALVSVDLIGVSARVRSAVKRRLEDLEPFELVLAATHNHAGPGGLTQVPAWRPAMGAFRPALFERTSARIADAIRAAHADLAPARIAHVQAPLRDLQRKRVGEVAG